MSLTIAKAIETKRDGGKLTKEQIDFFVNGVTDDSWQDHQISAMLMAMFIRGLDDEETASLTLAMADSGEQMDLSELGVKTADKHSTGGEGWASQAERSTSWNLYPVSRSILMLLRQLNR